MSREVVLNGRHLLYMLCMVVAVIGGIFLAHDFHQRSGLDELPEEWPDRVAQVSWKIPGHVGLDELRRTPQEFVGRTFELDGVVADSRDSTEYQTLTVDLAAGGTVEVRNAGYRLFVGEEAVVYGAFTGVDGGEPAFNAAIIKAGGETHACEPCGFDNTLIHIKGVAYRIMN